MQKQSIGTQLVELAVVLAVLYSILKGAISAIF